jgi:4-carboxymuconolactone decarboxylase
MTRLRPLQYDELDDEQRAVWDRIVSSRAPGGLELVGDDGGLIGPFNAFVHAPAVGRHSGALGATLRFATSLDRRLTELAICTVGAHWQAEFELWAHVPLALEAGVDQTVIDAVLAGETPEFERGDEAIVHAATSQLLRTGRCDAETYDSLVGLLGERGVVELTSLIGYYCSISFTLNMFEVPVPDQ